MHIDSETLALYAADDADDSHVTAHLDGCADCRATVEHYRRLRNAATVAPVSVPAGMVEQLWQRGTAPKRHEHWRITAVAASLIAASIAGIVLIPLLVSRHTDEFHSKGATTHAAIEGAGIDVYRVTGDGAQATPLGSSIHAGDGLTFAYRNSGQSPARYLMIVAVDAAKHTFWFYPAHDDASRDPESIAIDAGDDVHLPDIVTHQLSAGRLAIYGLFSSHPLRVSQVDDAITHTGEPHIEGVSQQRVDVEVSP